MLPDEDNVVSLAAMHSATLGEGLRKLARYKRLVCPELITIELVDGEARLRFEWLLRADGVPPSLLTDIIFAGVTNLAQRGTKTSVRPRRLEFIRRRANEAMLRRHFRCELRFDAPHDLLVFDEEALALPMVNRNAQLLSVLLPGLESAVEQDERALDACRRRALALSENHVRRLVPRRLPESRRVWASSAAATMQRRLGELGTTYQAVLDGIRQRSARQLLANTDVGIGEVAFLLGFEEVSSFTPAFLVWEGTTPAKWRERKAARREPQGKHGSAKVAGAHQESPRAHLRD